MKKNPFTIIFFFLLIISTDLYPQDFNLFNPSNEIYLFSAYDEGANAFRYNPAVLGLGHRLNAAVNVFLRNRTSGTDVGELDFLANSGSFGIAYRFAKLYSSNSPLLYPPYDQYLHTFSIGFGLGNKTFSGGILGEWQTPEKLYNASDNFDISTSRFRMGVGFLYRPVKFLSTAFTVKSKQSFTGISPTWRFTYGMAARPLLNNMLTLMLDYSNEYHGNLGFFEHYMLKLGVDVMAAKGFHLFGNFTRINAFSTSDYFNLGIRFDLPNFGVRYTNSFNKFTDRDNSLTTYKTAGQQISLSYNFEKRESIVKEQKRIFELTLSGKLQDYNTKNIFFGLLGKGKRSVHEVIADIDYAANDESVSGMLLKIYPLSGGMIFEPNAAVEELTEALVRFKNKGKKITAYLPDNAFPSEYYIASFADKIIMPEEGILYYGLTIHVINFRQFLEKYGIELQNFYAGKYKLTFQGLLDSSTAEGKEVIERILDVVYSKMLERIQKGRNITLDDYMKMKLSQPLTGREAKRLGLIDENGWFSDAKDIAKKESNSKELFTSLNRSKWDDIWGEPDEIAIIGVYSSITSGESRAPEPLPIPFFGSGRSTGSETVVRQLEDAFSNPKVKVVILRVDSGGGSALASAEISAAIVRLKKKYKKPFLVSMGGAAASGGYYVSVNADKIFCDALTITGSIGVFYSIPNLDSLLEEQKIKVETYKRGENSDINTITRKLNKKEIEIIQGIIDFYYDRFIDAVTEGRKLTREEAQKVAQGRVWLGTDAFNKRLVDEIGGLYETINYAKKVGKLGNRYQLVYYAVPDGNPINEIVTASLVQYLGKNLLKLPGFDNDIIDVKY